MQLMSKTSLSVAIAALMLLGCDSVKNTLLETQHPDQIDPTSLASAAGA